MTRKFLFRFLFVTYLYLAVWEFKIIKNLQVLFLVKKYVRFHFQKVPFKAEISKFFERNKTRNLFVCEVFRPQSVHYTHQANEKQSINFRVI